MSQVYEEVKVVPPEWLKRNKHVIERAEREHKLTVRAVRSFGAFLHVVLVVDVQLEPVCVTLLVAIVIEPEQQAKEQCRSLSASANLPALEQ